MPTSDTSYDEAIKMQQEGNLEGAVGKLQELAGQAPITPWLIPLSACFSAKWRNTTMRSNMHVASANWSPRIRSVSWR